MLNCPFLQTFQHIIEALLSFIWRKYGEELLSRRIAILDTWFTRVLCSEYPHFNKSKKKEDWSWSSLVRNYVRGIVPGHFNKLDWFDDVDTLYAPMNWRNDHWASLAVDLKSATITVLDQFFIAPDEKKVDNN